MKRIRILFFACRELDTSAAAQLIVAQNKLQNLAEFDVFRTWIYAERETRFPQTIIQRCVGWFASRHNRLSSVIHKRLTAYLDKCAFNFKGDTFKQDDWLLSVKRIVEQYDSYLITRSHPVDFRSIPTIVITDLSISNGFFSYTNGPLGLVSTANWKHYFKPASTLDYVLTSTQRLALRMLFNSQIDSHFETKGCIWDYCQYQPDSRISIFNGYICVDCCHKLTEVGLTHEQVDDLQSLVTNNWLGAKSDQYSISGILAKNYKYDLSRSTGPSSNFFTVILDGLREEIVYIIRWSVRWSIITVLTLFIITRFPSVVSFFESVRQVLLP